MHPNLVGAGSHRQTAQERVVREAFQHFKAGRGLLPLARVHAHHAGGQRVRREFGVDGELFFLGRSVNERHVAALRLFDAEQVGQRHEHGFGFRQQQDAGGFGVEAVRMAQIGELTFDRPRLAGGDARMQEL